MSVQTTIPRAEMASLVRALPFWSSLLLIPLAWVAAIFGSWTIALLPLATWYLSALLDAMLGLDRQNADPMTEARDLVWYRLITLIWAPLQAGTLFGILYFVSVTGHLGGLEQWLLFAALGIASGTIGINYSHELMHQKPRIERWMADILLAMVLYSHFRSEHLLVHHRHVATPRDPVSARYGEGFYRYFARVLRTCPPSAFRAEAAMLARRDRPWHDRANPLWRYAALQLGFVALAFSIGGLWGVVLFGVQAFTAIWQLELVNYVEHYGLTRRHLGNGKYEHVLPRHSWNAAHKASNWLLINLQRHSDHHYKPDRRFPLLQSHPEDVAPQLPYSYAVMTAVAMSPRLWRRVMNPRVRAWRRTHYPDITDWTPYTTATNPPPR